MNEELQQQLMEFVYDLLDEDEANALCERITSDPLVARAYAKVKLQCDLVGRAARIEASNVAWIRPDGDEFSNGPRPASSERSASGYRRLANWCLGVAASALICLVGSSYWMSSRSVRHELSPVALAKTGPIQVVLTGPSKLHSEASNPFTVQVENQAGTPVSTTLKYRVYDNTGAVAWQDTASTDASGIARFDVEPTVARRAAHLEVAADEGSAAPIQRELEAAPEQFVTYLRMDRPLYQPGERVSYRSVTLSRFGLQSEREVATSFEIVNADNEPLEASTKTVETQHGVGSGWIDLPSDLPNGNYTLIARSPDNLYRDEWRDFHVRRYEAPRLLKKLELAQDSYTLGDQVELEFSAQRVAGEPLADRRLQIQAIVDGTSLQTPEVKTDAEGKSQFSLRLPESIQRGNASVSVTVQEGDDPAETITKEIPINLGKVNVDFFPEGGDLAAGLPSRVYFYGRDPLGKPTHIEGHIVNSKGRKIANVATGHEGRGAFSFTPAAHEQYELIVEKPQGVTKEVPLPDASIDRIVSIHSGLGVFEANAPLSFTLFQRSPVRPLTVAAYCRGAMIGQQTIHPKEYVEYTTAYSTVNREMELPDRAQGVIRLTVFDSGSTPPTPIAERLVYRRVGQKLDVQFTPDATTFAPGQAVQLDLAIRDETDDPVPAVLGISIVDDAILNLADDQSTRLPTYFHLLTEIDSPEQLEDANFYLSDNVESAVALDSLLGTQGWRRFKGLPPTQLAQAGGGGFGGGGFDISFGYGDSSLRSRSLAWYDETAVPLSTESTLQLRENARERSTRLARGNSSSGTSLASPIIVASIVLLLMVGVGSLQWARSNRSLRAFAGVIAVASLAIGILSLPMKPTRVGQVTDTATPTASKVALPPENETTEIAANDILAKNEAVDTEQPEGMMSGAGDEDKLYDSFATPMAPAPYESGRTDRLGEPSKEVERFAAPESQKDERDREADAGASEKAVDALLNKAKKAEPQSLGVRQLADAAASAEKPQPAAKSALSGRAMLRAEQPQPFADDNVDSELLTRDYAKWFYEARSSNSPTDQSSTTIFWLPLHIADRTGRATVYFSLPPRPSRFRAIVEAHCEGRLGSAELLIDSREP